MRIFDNLVWVLGGGAILALLVGYLGVLHPFFDSMSVMRLHVLISLSVAFVYMAIRRSWVGTIVFGGAGAMGAIAMLPYFLTSAAAGDIAVMQANLLFRNDATGQVEFIMEAKPDIVTLQEVTNRSLPNLNTLHEYPTKVFCGFASVGGVMILSRYREIPDMNGCVEGQGMVWSRVMTPDGPVTIVSLHLHWPWPHGQAAQIDRLLPILSDLPQPIIVGGDFNMVPWSNAVHRIEDATNTQVLRGIRLTFDVYKGWGRLPIDQILVFDGNGAATKGPTLGSDHKSVLADISLRQ